MAEALCRRHAQCILTKSSQTFAEFQRNDPPNFDSCLMPLCPKCIQSHLEKHKVQGQHAELETVDEIHEETLELIRKQIENLNKAIHQLEKFRDAKSDAHGQLQELLAHARSRIQRVIDAFFDQLTSDLNHVTQNDKSGLDQEITQMERGLQAKIQDLHAIEQKLRTQKFLKQIIELQKSNFLQDLQQHAVECDAFIEEVSRRTLDIQINEDKLYNINMDMAKYIQIKNAEFYMSDKQIAKPQTSVMHPYLGQSGVARRDSRTSEMAYQPQQIVYSQPDALMQINCPDYFEPLAQSKFLHYFTEKSLFLINLEQSTFKWNEVKLSCQIPQKSTSLRTPQGEIYIIGGTINNQVSNLVLRFDLRTQSLTQMDQLVQARHSCSAVFLNQKIYVLGGAGQIEDLTTIEQLELAQSKSKALSTRPNLPKMQIGGLFLSVCAFRQYVIKASPMEVFDTRTLRWSYQNIQISKGIGMVQINNQNILIFGNGQYGLLKLIDQQAVLFTFEPQNVKDQRLQGIENGSLIHGGKIFALTKNRQLAIGGSEAWQFI